MFFWKAIKLILERTRRWRRICCMGGPWEPGIYQFSNGTDPKASFRMELISWVSFRMELMLRQVSERIDATK